MNDITLPHLELTRRCAAVFEACGSAPAEAHTVAANLALANLSGHDSHGVGMLPRYVNSILEGGLLPNASLQTVLDLGALLSLNGAHGFGQTMGEQAMHLGIARAKAQGSCIMALAHSHHLGRIGHFAEMAVAAGLVSLHFVNVMARPSVAAWGGADGRFGTNPCCIGIPLAGRDPFVLDFATSRVAQGKMRVAYNQGKSVAPGLLIDERGKPTTDPAVVVLPQSGGMFGALMPFGEHKGFGMAVACELLGGALTGGGTWCEPTSAKQAVYNGMLTVLIDPAKLGTQDAMDAQAVAFVDWLRASPPADGFDGVQMAGEPERAARKARTEHGICLDGQTWQDMVDAAGKVGVAL